MIKKIFLTISIVFLLLAGLALGGWYYWRIQDVDLKTDFSALAQLAVNPKSSAADLWSLTRALGGPDGQKNYLIVLQNNHELRPSGGFVGAYGIMTVEDGKIVNWRLDDSYGLDKAAERYLRIEPPPPIKEYITDYWWFRDANWSPDWPTSAVQLMSLYGQEGGREKLDGVVALDPTLITDVVDILGPLSVDGLEFNADNFIDDLQYQVEQAYLEQGIPKTNRKDIIGKLASQLMDRLDQAKPLTILKVVTVVLKNLEQKHLLVYSTDPKLQQQLIDHRWAGVVQSFDGDYLMVADANMVARKTDWVMNRTLSYQLRQRGNHLLAILTLRYTNTGEYDYRTSRMRDYTRVYVPAGSILLNATGAMQNDRGETADQPGRVTVGSELGKTVFGWFWYINPGESRTAILEYQLPDSLSLANAYTLLVQKQAGTAGHPLIIDVKLDNFEKQFQTDLTVDRIIEIGN
ncbi:DUF4012 domain-containing protein [Candidatus Falkowbacteria bacterium]|nr:DUF4012 domain-containing protein [Candidatus Falkowbacteria bacterium]